MFTSFASILLPVNKHFKPVNSVEVNSVGFCDYFSVKSILDFLKTKCKLKMLVKKKKEKKRKVSCEFSFIKVV